MQIIISPAKDLDFSSENSHYLANTEAKFLEKTQDLHKILQSLLIVEIAKLMKLSDKLAELNYFRFQEFSLPLNNKNAKQAIFAFNGDVYQGINAKSLNKDELIFLNKHLKILSGFYGVLQPSDLIAPYRLEMGTKLANKQGKDLYSFWQKTLTAYFNQLDDEVLLNLASNEYSKALDFKNLNKQIINVEFKDLKGDEYKIISFYAKKARGLMVRFIAQNKITNIKDLKEFNLENYYFDNKNSLENKLIFLRD